MSLWQQKKRHRADDRCRNWLRCCPLQYATYISTNGPTQPLPPLSTSSFPHPLPPSLFLTALPPLSPPPVSTSSLSSHSFCSSSSSSSSLGSYMSFVFIPFASSAFLVDSSSIPSSSSL